MEGELFKEMRKIYKDLDVNDSPSEYTRGYKDALQYFMDFIEEEELAGV